MIKVNANTGLYKLRDLSSAFSRAAFTDVLNFNDYSHFNWLQSKYELRCSTYCDFLRKIYTYLARNYRCEYVYKNELIKSLLKDYGTRDTVYFSEFRVGRSIADMVMFNGESKAFEIKTEYDSVRRLDKQMMDYKRLFDKCFLVIPEDRLETYLNIVDPTTGIIVMNRNNNRLCLEEVKPACMNTILDVKSLMSCLRMTEYMNIAISLGASLKNIPEYSLFKYCQDVISRAGVNEVRSFFLREMKKRRNNTIKLKKYPKQLRQIMLSLNLSDDKADLLLKRLNTNILE